MQSNKYFSISPAITAFFASLCCITPAFTLFAGIGGIASSFSWLEPLRPYLIVITFFVLGYAWYRNLSIQNKDEIQCDCENKERPSFWHSRKFLWIITVFSIAMLTFPYYSTMLYSENKRENVSSNPTDIELMRIGIEGMTCESCEQHIIHTVKKVNGVVEADVDYRTGKAEVKYNKTQTSKKKIVESINSTGYEVINIKK